MSTTFLKKLENKWEEGKFVCVGLDSDYTQLPPSIKLSSSISSSLFNFNKQIIDNTYDLVCCYKFQSSFYEAEGVEGLKALKQSIDYLIKNHPDIPTILDAKRGDIGNTNLGYVKSIFDGLGFDAVTVNPYLGGEALEPFLQKKDKGIIILVKTSNPGAGEFQDLPVGKKGEALYLKVAKHVANNWNKNGNCAVVVGATYPKDLAKVRKVIGDLPILIPGAGSQGGELEATINAGKDSRGWGMIIHSARGIIFASKEKNFAKLAKVATKKLDQKIREYVK